VISPTLSSFTTHRCQGRAGAEALGGLHAVVVVHALLLNSRKETTTPFWWNGLMIRSVDPFDSVGSTRPSGSTVTRRTTPPWLQRQVTV